MTIPTPKDIEAAEKLSDREFLQLCETALAKGPDRKTIATTARLK